MKISIIGGAGRVGSNIAFSLLLQDIQIDELILYDIVDSVEGESLDLQQAALALNREIKILSTKIIQDCENSDIVVIAAGVSLSKAETLDRNLLLEKNISILKSILDNLQDNNKTIYIINTNPVDVITYFLNKKIKNRKKVIGISTITDTARMNTFSKGYLIGEHAGSMIPIEGEANIEKVKDLGSQVIKSKGGTWFLTPVGISNIIKSIVNNEKKQFPISILLEGEHDLKDTCLSIPCIIGREGIEEIIEINLNKDQKEILNKAASSIKEKIELANRYWSN